MYASQMAATSHSEEMKIFVGNVEKWTINESQFCASKMATIANF